MEESKNESWSKIYLDWKDQYRSGGLTFLDWISETYFVPTKKYEEVEKLKVHNTVEAINARRIEKELAKTNGSEGQEEGKQ